MNDAALICDSSALLAYLDRLAPDHRAFRKAIDSAQTRYVPGLVLAEVDTVLRNDRAVMRALARDLSTGAFTFVPLELASIERAMKIDQLGLVDASIVALAEEIEVLRLATRDVADFSAIRLRDGSAFEMVVVPRR